MPIKIKSSADSEDKINLRKLQQSFSLEGKNGGQEAYGGAVTGENLELHSNKSKDGKIYLGDDSAYDESNVRLGVGTTSPSSEVEVVSSSNPQLKVASTGLGVPRVTLDTGAQEFEWRVNGAVIRLRDNTNNTEPFQILAGAPTTSIQVRSDGSVGFGGTPNSSAKVDIQSTTEGFLPPRMTTTQRNAISSPAAGLMIFNTTTSKTQTYDGSTWQDHW